MSSLITHFQRSRHLLLAVVFTLLSVTILTACGDPTVTPIPPVNKATPTPMSNEDLVKQSGAGSTAQTSAAATTVAGSPAAGTTAASGTTATGATSAAGATTAAGAASTTQAAAPKATPTGTTQADVPSLAYPGAREIKLSDAITQQLLDNFANDSEDEVIGKFQPNKVGIYLSQDDINKIEDFFKKALEAAGWQQFSRNGDGTRTLLVYQKNGTKLAAQFGDLGSPQGLPPEIAQAYKQGDRLVIVATGQSFVPPPTPFAIPGTPTIAVGAGQKKYATIEMENGGKVQIELYPDVAPRTVENFEKLATKGFYNGLTFHRVEKDPTPFVVQGGDPKGDGTGGPGYTIPDEFTTKLKHETGTVAMAHSQAPNSAGSQFYICLSPQPSLDGKYAIFGKVTEGMDVVNNIKIGDKMKSVTITVK